MLCNQCSKDVSAETAIWMQDFSAKTIAFCARACQALWYAAQFPVQLKSHAAEVATGQQNASAT
jgi:hypothetical protein